MTDIRTRNHNNIFFKARHDILVCLFLAIAITAVYWQVGNHSFINYVARENLFVRVSTPSLCPYTFIFFLILLLNFLF
jgi:hypothetical protein